MNFTLGERVIDLGEVIFLVETRDCNRMKGIARAEQILSIPMNRVQGNENPYDILLTSTGELKYDILGSLRAYLQSNSYPLNEREETARSFASFCSQMHNVATARQIYVTNMDKDGFPRCVVKCYGKPSCSYTQGQYNSVRTKAIDSAISWSDLRNEFNLSAETLSEQGDSIISDQEALARLNRIQADSKQAQAEADNKALLADLMRIGIGVVAIVVVYFLWKYVAKFVR